MSDPSMAHRIETLEGELKAEGNDYDTKPYYPKFCHQSQKHVGYIATLMRTEIQKPLQEIVAQRGRESA